MSVDSDTRMSTGWVENASTFLDYGYSIVPVEPLPGTPRDVDDPVVQQLGSQPLVNRITGAASTKAEVEKLGQLYDEARVAAVTGEDSDLLAVEVNKAGGWEEDPFWQRITSLTENFPGVVSSTREYVFLPYPNLEEPLPAITKKKGVVLHGEDSIIHLPGGDFEWKDRYLNGGGDLPKRDERRARARKVLKLFGLEDYLAFEDEAEEERALQETGDNLPPQRDEAMPDEDKAQLDLPLQKQSSNGHSTELDSDTLFRSGDKLKLPTRNKNGRLNAPWTVPGGLSILTGPPKIAGKSSWVLNFALHLSAGEPFFGFENPPSDVVLLADTSPSNLRELLAQVSFVDRDRALSHLHVLHPRDVVRLDWQATLGYAYDHVNAIGADLLIVDCLDRYVRLKGDCRPTESEEVVHKLTAESPPECPVLGVKSTDCRAEESFSATIDRLGILGVSADAIVRLDDISTEKFPCLRRLATVSRRGAVSQTHFCSLRSGRYVRVRQSDLAGLTEQHLLGEPTSPKSPSALNSGHGALLQS
jgi:hypothetical protein